MRFDIRSDLLPTLAFAATIASNTTTSGAIIDTADYDLGSQLVALLSAFTDGIYEIQVWESDQSNMSGATQITNTDQLIGSIANLTALTAQGANPDSLGFIGNKRYIQVRVVSTGVTTGARVIVLLNMKGEVLPDNLLN